MFISSRHKRPEVAVIGAGIGGVLTALELVGAGCKVTLLERGAGIMSLTTRQNAFRLHQGYHYPKDEATALECLRTAVGFKKRFSDTGGIYSTGNWWNIVTKKNPTRTDRVRDQGSYLDFESLYEIAERLREEYKDLVRRDSKNKVFGNPEEFFSVISEDESEKWLNPDRAGLGIASCEEIIDISKVRSLLSRQLEVLGTTGNVSLELNAPVTGLDRKDGSWEVTRENNGKQKHGKFDAVVNATWSFGNETNKLAGFKGHNRKLTTRLKPVVYADLPEDLCAIPSTFFLLGRYANFTNMGEGRIAITFAPETNVARFDGRSIALEDSARFFPQLKAGEVEDGKIPPEWRELMFGGYNASKHKAYGRAVLEGAAEFVPGLERAQVNEVRFGTVISLGSVEIDGQESDHHLRTGMDPRRLDMNFYEMCATKLAHSHVNALKTTQMVSEDLGIALDSKLGLGA